MIFAYSARDPMGREVEGELEAANAEAVVTQLVGRSLQVRWVRPTAAKGHSSYAQSPPASWSSGVKADAPSTFKTSLPAEPISTTEDTASLEEAVDRTSGGTEADAGSADTKSGCSPWSLVLFLLFLSQMLRAC